MLAARKRILYVDKDGDGAPMMKAWLRFGSETWDITTAAGIDEALAWIEKSYFHLYVLDDCSPAGTNCELCQIIRELDKKTPLLVYSELEDDSEKRTAINAGANDYLTKPSEFDLLKPTIQKLLEQGVHSFRTAAANIIA